MENTQDGQSSRLLRTCLWLLIVGVIITFLIYFRGLLIPLAYAVIISYLISEVMALTGRITINGKPAHWVIRAIIAFLVVMGVIFLVVQIIVANVDEIVRKAPEYRAIFNDIIAQIGAMTKTEDFSRDFGARISSMNIEGLISDVFNSFSVLSANLFLIIIYSIFILLEKNVALTKLRAIIKDPRQRGEIEMIVNQINQSIRQYLSVKTVASLVTALISYGILRLFDVDFPVLWAFLIFLFNYIPYIGSMIATLLPSFLAVFQFESLLMGFWVFLSIQAVQTLIGSILEPRFAGRTLNLSPLVVLLSLSLWGIIWGVVGMAIAVPVTSILVIVLAEFPNTRSVAIILSERGSVLVLTDD